MKLLAFAAIGRAVLAAQVFEHTFIPMANEGLKAFSEPECGERYITPEALKQRISVIVKKLDQKKDIAPDLAERLTQYIEDRNTLIHRWIGLHGWPDDNDAEGFRPIIELANRVESEARALTSACARYVVEYGNREWIVGNGDARIKHQHRVIGAQFPDGITTLPIQETLVEHYRPPHSALSRSTLAATTGFPAAVGST